MSCSVFIKVRYSALRSALVACIAVFAPAIAGAQTVTFGDAINSTGAFGSFGEPAINASGRVAFFGRLDGGFSGIYTVADGTTTTIADRNTATGAGGNFERFGINPSINASGTVAFNGFVLGGIDGVFTGTGGAVINIANNTTTNGGALLFTGKPAINNSGIVVLSSSLDAGGKGIFSGTGGGSVATVADTNTTSGGAYFTFDNPTINDSGSIVFSGIQSLSGGATYGAILSASGGTLSTLADTTATNGGAFGFFNTAFSPSVNAAGTVAFHADLDGGGQGIFTSSGDGTARTIADTATDNGAFNFFTSSPAINAAGTVAFAANVDGPASGIFAALAGVTSPFKVIRTGDSLFGSLVSSVEFGRLGLNDANQLAFGYTLANGRSGIAVANIVAPVVVPEAGTLALVLPALGVLGTLLIRRRE